MTAMVIQGWFPSGQPKLTASVQPKMTAPAHVQAKAPTRSPGPPAPAFAGRPGAVQPQGGAFAVEAGPLGLASGDGKPLPDAVRSKMEAALGADFSSVRVHVGPQAERIGAIAFTLGSDIYFAPGRYQPQTPHGRQLLGHELAHVVQQRAGRVRNPLGSRLTVVQDTALEAEADRMGQRAAAHHAAVQPKMRSGATPPTTPVRISPPISTGPGSYKLIAGAGARQVGSVVVHAGGKGAIEVTDLQVSAPQRGLGIGRMLLASAAKTGRQFGGSMVSLAAQDNGNGHLKRWYREMGFAQAGINERGHPQLEAPIGRVLAGAAQGLHRPLRLPKLSAIDPPARSNAGPSPILRQVREVTAPRNMRAAAVRKPSFSAVRPNSAVRIYGSTTDHRGTHPVLQRMRHLEKNPENEKTKELRARGQALSYAALCAPTSGVNLWRMENTEDNMLVYVLGTAHGLRLSDMGADSRARRFLIGFLQTEPFTHILTETKCDLPYLRHNPQLAEWIEAKVEGQKQAKEAERTGDSKALAFAKQKVSVAEANIGDFDRALDDAYCAIARVSPKNVHAKLGELDIFRGVDIRKLARKRNVKHLGIQEDDPTYRLRRQEGEPLSSDREVVVGNQAELFLEVSEELRSGRDIASAEERNSLWVNRIGEGEVRSGDRQLWIVGAAHIPGLVLRFQLLGWHPHHMNVE
jgi:ribosomal protein S18 acetylase RimI-like enzyme